MTEKVDRLQSLLRAGFVIEEIDSDGGFVETTLRRGSETIVLRLARADAEDILVRQSVQ